MMTLTPAYGRDYRSKTACLNDLTSGKDFIINDIQSRWDGKPISIRDMRPGETVKVRYAQLTKVFVYTR